MGAGSDEELSVMFRDYYASVSNSTPQSDYKDCEHTTFPIKYTTNVMEVLRLLDTIDIKKATGPDNLGAWLIREHSVMLAEPFTMVFNASLKSGVYPKAWKTATIKPLPKRATPEEISDYRPVSLTPIISKLFEKILRRHLTSEITSQLDTYQHAYRPNRSCEHALAHIIYHTQISRD
jgi:hypothetical protein